MFRFLFSGKNKKMLILTAPILFCAVISTNSFALIQVGSFSDLSTAIAGGETEIELTSDFDFDGLITLPDNTVLTIDGKDKKISRATDYTDGLFVVPATSELTIMNLKEDGKAGNWQVRVEDMHRPTSGGSYMAFPIDMNGDVASTTSLIINNGKLTLKDSSFVNNVSTASGSVINNKKDLVIDGSQLKKNYSSDSGGGVIVSGSNSTVNINNSIFRDNLIGREGGEGVSYGGSGAVLDIEVGGSLRMINSIVADNVAESNGGFAYINGASVYLENNTFEHNQIGNDGGVMEVYGKPSVITNQSFVSKNNTYKNNMAHAPGQSIGGAVTFGSGGSAFDGAIVFDGDEFEGNFAAAVGGSIATFTDSGNEQSIGYFNFDIKNCDFTNNKGNSGGALYFQLATNVSVTDSVFIGNEANGAGGVIYGSYADKVIMKRLTIENSKAKVGAGLALYNNHDIEMDNVVVKNNYSAQYGGGIYYVMNNSINDYYDTYKVMINNSTISNNNSDGDAGGLLFSTRKEGTEINIKNTSITDNYSGGYGGGIATIHLVDSYIKVDSASKLYNNTAELGADDIYVSAAIDEYADRPGAVYLNVASDMDVNGVDDWYLDNPDERYSDDNKTTQTELVITNESNHYIKAAGDAVDGPNPSTADEHGIFVLMALLSGIIMIGGVTLIKRR